MENLIIAKRLSRAEHDRDRYKRRIEMLQGWLAIARDNTVRCGECREFMPFGADDTGYCSDLGVQMHENQTCFMGDKKTHSEG